MSYHSKPLTHTNTHHARRQTHPRTTYTFVVMVTTTTTHTTKSKHTTLEVLGWPGTVWMGVVGCYATGRHKKKVREVHSEQGGAICWHMEKALYWQVKKNSNKPARKRANTNRKRARERHSTGALYWSVYNTKKCSKKGETSTTKVLETTVQITVNTSSTNNNTRILLKKQMKREKKANVKHEHQDN